MAQPAEGRVGMAVVPSKIELKAVPGSSQTQQVKVINANRNPIRLTLRAWDFARDANGNAVPISPKDVKQFRGMAGWVRFADGDFVIPAGKTGTAKLIVKVPRDAQPGGHYTYVTFRGLPMIGKTKGVVIPVAYNISALLVVELPGGGGEPPVLRENVRIMDLMAPRVSFGGPVALQIWLNNGGNVHTNFKGMVNLNKGPYRLGSKQIPEYTLLPYSKMNIVQDLGGAFPFGYFEARVVGDIGLDKPIEAKTGFWVIPTSLILWSFGGLMVLIVAVLLLRGRFQLVKRPT